MDSEYLGMKTVDPIILNSLTVALPEEQLSFLMRRINVTGARWTKLLERKYVKQIKFDRTLFCDENILRSM